MSFDIVCRSLRAKRERVSEEKKSTQTKLSSYTYFQSKDGDYRFYILIVKRERNENALE